MDLERRDFLKLAAGALTYSLATDAAWAQTSPQTGKVHVQWLGQASTKITTPTGKVIVIEAGRDHDSHRRPLRDGPR